MFPKLIILAAGKATRLLPLTKGTPQCLLKVGEKTILQRQLELAEHAGLESPVVITGYLSKQVEQFCEEKNVKTLFNPFYNVSGMAMTLWIAREELKNGFLLIYSDILFESSILEKIARSEEDFVLAVKKNGLRNESESAYEESGIIKSMGKEDGHKGNCEFIGVMKCSARGSEKLLQSIKNESKNTLHLSLIHVLNKLIEKGEKITALDIQNSEFIDIDFIKDLDKAAKLFK